MCEMRSDDLEIAVLLQCSNFLLRKDERRLGIHSIHFVTIAEELTVAATALNNVVRINVMSLGINASKDADKGSQWRLLHDKSQAQLANVLCIIDLLHWDGYALNWEPEVIYRR